MNRLHHVNEVKLPVNGAHMDAAAGNGQAHFQNAARTDGCFDQDLRGTKLFTKES